MHTELQIDDQERHPSLPQLPPEPSKQNKTSKTCLIYWSKFSKTYAQNDKFEKRIPSFFLLSWMKREGPMAWRVTRYSEGLAVSSLPWPRRSPFMIRGGEHRSTTPALLLFYFIFCNLISPKTRLQYLYGSHQSIMTVATSKITMTIDPKEDDNNEEIDRSHESFKKNGKNNV